MTQGWIWKAGRTLALAGITLFYATNHTPKVQACWRCVIDPPYAYCVQDVLSDADDCQIQVDGSCVTQGSGCLVD
jgi:hypothetical protein